MLTLSQIRRGEDREYEAECTCHLGHPPCGYCENLDPDNVKVQPHFPAETPELEAELKKLPRAFAKPNKPAQAADLASFKRTFSHPICMTCGTPQYGRIGEALVRRGIARPPLLEPPADGDPEDDLDDGVPD